MINTIKNEIKKTIVGQEELINMMLICLISGGHLLVEGIPGLAKTTAINTIAKALGIGFKRIQFTPDLLPSDLIGAEIYNPKTGEFTIKQGPVFTNLLLADEINRAPAKVQSALLEIMQEKQVTIGGQSIKVDEPFLVMATQNPIEQEGTYQLPEAQLDRFMLKVDVGYNTLDEEIEIINRVVVNGFKTINKIADANDIVNLRNDFNKIHIDEEMKKYITQIIFASRFPNDYGLNEIAEFINFGASPRGSIDLYKASCAHALICGKDFVTPLDVSSVAQNVLRHRIVLSYKAQAENISADYIIKQILTKIKAP